MPTNTTETELQLFDRYLAQLNQTYRDATLHEKNLSPEANIETLSVPPIMAKRMIETIKRIEEGFVEKEMVNEKVQRQESLQTRLLLKIALSAEELTFYDAVNAKKISREFLGDTAVSYMLASTCHLLVQLPVLTLTAANFQDHLLAALLTAIKSAQQVDGVEDSYNQMFSTIFEIDIEHVHRLERHFLKAIDYQIAILRVEPPLNLASSKQAIWASESLEPLDAQALFDAIKNDDFSLFVQELDLHPHLLDVRDIFGQTPLIWAASLGQARMVDHLLDLGAEIHWTSQCLPTDADRSKHGFSAIDWAILRNHASIVTTLSQHGAIVQIDELTMAFMRLHRAARKGDCVTASALLERFDFLINTSPASGHTPLHWASIGGHLAMVQLLVSKGADVNALMYFEGERSTATFKDIRAYAPLDWALQSMMLTSGEHLAVAVFLQQQQALAYYPHTRLAGFDLSDCIYYRKIDYAYLLVSVHSVLLKTPSKEGLMPLQLAARYGTPDLVDYFIRSGVNIEEKTPDKLHCDRYRLASFCNMTPLQIAIRAGKESIAIALLVAGALAPSDKGFQAMHLSVQHGLLAVMQRLIREDPNHVNIRDHEGLTPLLRAVMFNQWACVKFLVACAGIDLNAAVTQFGAAFYQCTALDIVDQKKVAVIYERLRQAGARHCMEGLQAPPVYSVTTPLKTTMAVMKTPIDSTSVLTAPPKAPHAINLRK